MMEAFDETTGEIMPGRAMPPAIAAAIIAVKAKVRQLGADERNQHGGYNYVSVDKMYATIGKLMAEAGLALLIDETVAEVRTSERARDDGKAPAPWLFVQYDLAFMHESGAVSAPLRRSCALPISGPQAYGAAQSYIEKQFLRQVFKVPTGEKDADDIAQSDEAPAATRQPPKRQKAAPASTQAEEDARQRYKDLVAAIDTTGLAGLTEIDVSLESDVKLKAVPEHKAVMIERLRARIKERHDAIMLEPEPAPAG